MTIKLVQQHDDIRNAINTLSKVLGHNKMNIDVQVLSTFSEALATFKNAIEKGSTQIITTSVNDITAGDVLTLLNTVSTGWALDKQIEQTPSEAGWFTRKWFTRKYGIAPEGSVTEACFTRSETNRIWRIEVVMVGEYTAVYFQDQYDIHDHSGLFTMAELPKVLKRWI